MKERSRDWRRPSPALVVSVIALVFAVGGVTVSQGAPDFATGASAASASCDPDGAVDEFIDCVSVTLATPSAGRALVIAQGGMASDGDVGPINCRLEVDDSTAGFPHDTTVEPGETQVSNTDADAQNGFALTAVTDVLPSGSHDFDMSCDDPAGDGADISVHNLTISVARLR